MGWCIIHWPFLTIKLLIMKRIIFIIITLLYTLLVFMSCSKEQVEQISVVSNTANKSPDVRSMDWAGSLIANPCTEELMTAVVWNVSVRSSKIITNNKVTLNTHITSHMKLVGESGIKYTGSTNYIDHSRYLSGDILSIKMRIKERITSEGGNNLFFTYLCVVTIYPDGTYIYSKDPVYLTSCK